eukprot:11072325-Ditylum_brightwellii.AAC.1
MQRLALKSPHIWTNLAIVALKAELKRKEKIIKLFKLSTPYSSLKQPYHPTICHTNKESKYNSKENPDYYLKSQVGKGKDFATRADIFAWKHIPLKNDSTYCIHNVLRWCWCTKCESLGSHEAEVCRHNFGPRKQPTKHAYIATKCIPIDVDADEMSDSESESDNTSIPSNSAFLNNKELNG